MTHRIVLRIGMLLAFVVNILPAQTPGPIAAQAQGAAPSSAAAGQTKTRLADGRWLVIGGEDASVSASIWDPRTQTSTPTAGTPVVPRAWHTATLLADGTVLIAGGRNSRGLVDTAELFDPAIGTFTQLTISGTVARASHTATLLMDGRVLIAGGSGSGDAALPTELWEIGAQTASPMAGEGLDRTGHTATLMSDGRVRVSGGQTAANRERICSSSIPPAVASRGSKSRSHLGRRRPSPARFRRPTRRRCRSIRRSRCAFRMR